MCAAEPRVRLVNASPQLLRSVLPSVAGISTRVASGHPSATLLGEERRGSGIVVGSGPLVLTVNYVVLGATDVQVTFGGGSRVPGRVVAHDFFSGLAVIDAAGGTARPARTLTDAGLEVGQEVFLVASVGEEERRANTGVVSSIEPFAAYWEYCLDRAIFTTAMNPGLGGGGVFDCRGRLAGIVSLDLMDVGRFTLAIPVQNFTAHRDELLQHGRRVTRPPRAWVGLYCYEIRQHVVIAGVLPGAPADLAGLRPGDVILDFEGVPVTARRSLYESLWARRPGETVHFQVFRNNEIRDVAVVAADAEEFFA